MNLLMISGDRSILAGKRGAFWYTLEELHKHFDRIDVICPRFPHLPTPSPGGRGGALPHPMSEEASEKKPFPNVFFHPSPWPLLMQPLWILRKGKELVAVHHHAGMTVHEYPPFYNGLGAIRLSRRTGVPFALEVHHIVGWPAASSLVERIGRMLSRVILPPEARRAAAVRCVNREVQSILISWGIAREKVEIVPSFYIDTTVNRPDPNVQKEYDVAFCGRLVANKGLDDLLQAMLHLPDKRLLVIGDGPLRAHFEALARGVGIADRVTFAGWLPSSEDVSAALRSARVFAMVSRSEGGPRIALEAMACGLPVLATKVGVMPDVITDGENGMFVASDPAAIASSLRILLADDTLCVRLGAAAAASVAPFERKAALATYARFLHSLSRR